MVCEAHHILEAITPIEVKFENLDTVETDFKIENFVKLEIRKAEHGTSLPYSTVEYPAKALSYTTTSTANIGDHMELTLVDELVSAEGGMFDLYA